jgi:hypothetical protein
MAFPTCPLCGTVASRLGRDFGPIQCPECGNTFTPPGEQRLSVEPVRPVVPTLDEDTPPEPSRSFVVDLSGNYRASVSDWLATAATHYRPYTAKPAVGFIALHIGLTFMCSIYLFFLLFRAPFACGFFLMAVRQIRGERWDRDTPFSAYRCFGRLFLANLIYLMLYGSVFVALVIAGEELFQKAPVMVPIGLLTGLGLLFFYIHVRLWPMNALIVERNMGVDQAFLTSLRLTHGHVLAWSGLMLLLMSLVLLGIGTLGIGLIFLAPYITLAEASAYLHATGQIRPSPAEGKS